MSRTFRIFVSSTFSDLKVERNALQLNVFPKLRELCRDHGCRFQPIDLRWGVSEEASLDHQTMRICLEEIKRCQRVTPRPNFIVLLGNRHGYRPLPAEIPEAEFAAIQGRVRGAADQRLLRHWYRRDRNAVPAVCCLRPRAVRRRENQTEAERAAAAQAEAREWAKVEADLRFILVDAIEPFPWTAKEKAKYTASATEQEIECGVMETPDAADHVFCFFREFRCLPTGLAARQYVDLHPDGQLDAEAQARLQELKDRLRARLPDKVRSYPTEWDGSGATPEHLERLCRDVHAALEGVILKEIHVLEAQDPLEKEVSDHRRFERERASFFTGRLSIQEAIQAYLEAGPPSPLAIAGPSGVGKTALLAKAAERSRQGGSAVVVERFIGATPGSSDGRLLLASVCEELGAAYGRPEPLPTDYLELTQELRRRLEWATTERPLVIFLDALDQLSAVHTAYNLAWLPAELPPAARLVVSTLKRSRGRTGTEREILRALAAKLPRESWLDLGPLTFQEGRLLLDRWFTDTRRRLRPSQRAAVLACFERCRLPLWLKLAFEEARRWRSYDPAQPLGAGIAAVVDQLFNRLSSPAQHGAALVGRALGYLAAARQGLSEDELLDVLSRDEAVFAEFLAHARHELPATDPAQRRLPVVVWARLFSSLEAYLAERSAEGVALLSFYHRQLGESAGRRFLGAKERLARHRALAAYFQKQLSAWSWSEHPEFVRHPLAELIYQQIEGQLWGELAAALTELDLLEAKCRAGMTYDLVADYNAAAAARGFPEASRPVVEPFRRFLRAQAHVLARRPKLFLQQAANEPDATAPAAAAQRRLAERAEARAWLRLVNKAPRPSPCLMVFTGHVGDVNGCDFSPDGKQLVSGGEDRTVKLWDMETGVERMTLFGHRSPVVCCAYSPDGACIASGGGDGSLKLWDPLTGVEIGQLVGHTEQIESCAFSRDGRRLVSAGNDNTLRVWDVRKRRLLATLTAHRDTAMGCAFSPDGQRIATADLHGNVILWDAHAYRPLKRKRAHAAEIRACAFSPDGQWLLSASSDHTFRRWKADLSGQPLTFTGHTDAVWCCSVAPDGRRVASASIDRTIRIWDLSTGQNLATLSGHTNDVMACAFLPDGKRLISCSWDGTVRLWDTTLSLSTPTPALEPLPPVFGDPAGDKRIWLACEFSPDGSKLAAGSEDHVRLWDASTGTELATLAGHSDYVRNTAFSGNSRWLLSSAGNELFRWDMLRPGAKPVALKGHTGFIYRCHVSPDGRMALSCAVDGSVRLWDLETGRLKKKLVATAEAFTACAAGPQWRWAAVGTLEGMARILDLEAGTERAPFRAHAEAVICISISPDGERIATSGMDRVLRVWEASSGKLLAELKGHAAALLDCAYSPDGRSLVSASRDWTLKVWDAEEFKLRRTLKGHSEAFWAVAWSSDGRRLISGAYDGTLRLWNPETGSQLAMLVGPRNWAGSCAFSGDGARLATASHRRTVKVYDGHTGEPQLILAGHTGEIRACALSPDGALVLSASADRTLRLWDATTGQLRHVLAGHLGPVQTCAFSPDGTQCVSGSWDRSLKLWDTRTGRERATLRGHTDWLQRVGFSPDGQIIASGGLDGTVRLWRVTTGELLATLRGHGDAVQALAFAKAGRRVLSASGDGALKLWEADTGQELLHLAGHSAAVTACDLSPDGRWALSGSMDHSLRLWDLESGGKSFVLGEHDDWIADCAFSRSGAWCASGSADKTLRVYGVGERFASQPPEGEYWAGAPVRQVAWHPRKEALVAGDEDGRIHFLQLEGFGAGGVGGRP